MTAKDLLKNAMAMANHTLTTYLSDLKDADLMVRSVPEANHIAWQLGHLMVSEHQMLRDAGFRMPDLPKGVAESYTKETSKSDDVAKFHKKAQYLEWLSQQRAGTLAALDKITEADLDKPSPERMRGYAPNLGALLNLVGLHEMMHAAQFVAVRRKLGKPILI